MPPERAARLDRVMDRIAAAVAGYVAGAMAIALIAGTLTFIVLSILGVPYAAALALIIALLDLVPLVGATLGAVVGTLAAFSQSVTAGIITLIFFIVYQQVENFLIYPKVMRRAVKVSDLAAIVAALLGFALLGIVGALIAIPVVAAIQLIVREVVIPRQQLR